MWLKLVITISALTLAAGGLRADQPATEKTLPVKRVDSQLAVSLAQNVPSASPVSRSEQKLNSISKPANAKNKFSQGITPEREAAVKTFVERNHPELAELLALLRANQPKEYERAIRELHRVTERLAGVQERDSQQYDLEIRAWQVHSRIQLLAARLKMADSEDVRRDLKDAIREQFDARTALLQHERQRVADRLTRIETDLARVEGDRESLVQKQFDMLTHATGEAKGKSKGTGKKSATKAAASP